MSKWLDKVLADSKKAKLVLPTRLVKAEVIPGGLAEGKTDSDFNPTQLNAGTEVEMEHTNDRAAAREIARDHLAEDPHYYKKLKRMEAKKALVLPEEFLKGFSYPVGTMRDWQGGTYKKISPNRWVKVKDGLGKKERGIRLVPQIDPPPPIGKELSEAVVESTKGKQWRQATKDIEQLYSQAYEANQELIDKTFALAKATGGEPALAPSVLAKFENEDNFRMAAKLAKGIPDAKVVINEKKQSIMVFDLHKADRLTDFLKDKGIAHENSRGIKGKERAVEKATFRYADEQGNPGTDRLTDLVRSSLKFDSVADVYKAVERIQNDPDMEIVKFKDRFRAPYPGGYRDISMNVRMSNGHVAELQLHIGAILDVKFGPGHDIFEKYRKMEAQVDKEKRAYTKEEARQIYKLAAEQERLYGEAYRSGLRGLT